MKDERYYLALDKLHPILNGAPNYLDVWLSRNYSEESWRPRLNQWQAKIDKLREWVKSLDWLDRRAYSGWLDHYQRYLDSAWSEIRTQKEKRRMDAYDRSNQEKEDKKKAFLESSGFPNPPMNR